MEILQPIVEQPKEKVEQHDPLPGEEKLPSLKHIEFLSELGLKDEMGNETIMEKIDYLTRKTDINGLKELSLRVGNDNWTSKLDKIYSYLKLSEEKNELNRKVNLIDETLNNYGRQN